MTEIDKYEGNGSADFACGERPSDSVAEKHEESAVGLQVAENHQGNGGLRSSSNREHLVRGDISLLTEVRFARRAISNLRKAPRLFFGGEHADATTYTGHVHDAG